MLQESVKCCAELLEVPGKLTLSVADRSVYFEPELTSQAVTEFGLSAYQAYIQLCDVLECGAITGPPLDESISDKFSYYLQFTLSRLNGRAEVSPNTSFVVIFRFETDRSLFRFAKAILKTMPAENALPVRMSLTFVPFSSEQFLHQISGASPIKHEYEEMPSIATSPQLSQAASPGPRLLLHPSDRSAHEFLHVRPAEYSWLATSEILHALRGSLPLKLRFSDSVLGYTPKVHGTSLGNFYRHLEIYFGVEEELPALLIVQDTTGKIFGCFTTHRWQIHGGRFFGNGECFVFSFDASGALKIFPWTGHNALFQFADDRRFLLGGSLSGGKAALIINQDWLHGSSFACDTFGSEPLGASEDFIIKDLELWSFTRDDS